MGVDQVNVSVLTLQLMQRRSYWNMDFRNRGKFAHPNPFIANGIKPKPPLFEYLTKAAVDATTFVLDHLDHFAVVMLLNELQQEYSYGRIYAPTLILSFVIAL